ncbi:hypothetical protein Btru_053763 [Bulinus truncatus]|nr:hypothetical protein Btru_053763 [Bulinus truncatus]
MPSELFRQVGTITRLVLKCRSVLSPPVSLTPVCLGRTCCLTPDATHTEHTLCDNRFILGTSASIIKFSEPSESSALPTDDPTTRCESYTSLIRESSVTSLRALVERGYVVSDSETSGVVYSSENDDEITPAVGLCLPGVKRVVSLDFNIIHIDPEDRSSQRFLLYRDHVKSNSNNNLVKQAQVFYVPLKLYGIRQDHAAVITADGHDLPSDPSKPAPSTNTSGPALQHPSVRRPVYIPAHDRPLNTARNPNQKPGGPTSSSVQTSAKPRGGVLSATTWRGDKSEKTGAGRRQAPQPYPTTARRYYGCQKTGRPWRQN